MQTLPTVQSLILVDFWTALLGPALLHFTMGHNFDLWWGFGSLLVHAGSASRSWWSTISDQQDAATCVVVVVDCELESMCQKKQIQLFWILLSRYDWILDNSRFRVDSLFDRWYMITHQHISQDALPGRWSRSGWKLCLALLNLGSREGDEWRQQMNEQTQLTQLTRWWSLKCRSLTTEKWMSTMEACCPMFIQ